MNMIEKVARAICKAHFKHMKDILDEIVEGNWSYFIPEAKAAIEAMREPTEEMMKEFPYDWIEDDVRTALNKLIDAALKE